MSSCVANNFPSYRKQWLLFFTKQINKLDTKTHVYLHRRYTHLSGTPSRTYCLITTAVMVAQEGPRPGMAASLSSWFMGCTAAKGTKKLSPPDFLGMTASCLPGNFLFQVEHPQFHQLALTWYYPHHSHLPNALLLAISIFKSSQFVPVNPLKLCDFCDHIYTL